MAYTLSYSLALGPAYAATADLRAQLVDTTGANVGSAISTGFTIIGTGFHLWNYAAMPDAHRGGVKFYSNAASSVVLAFLSVNPEEAENTDVKTSSRLATDGYTTPPTATAIDTQLSGTHGAGSWATATGFATPTNVSDAQTAITNAIAALNDLSTGDIDARLLAYDGATQADLTTSQTAIIAAIPGASAIVTAIYAVAIETGHDLTTVLRVIYAAIAGKSTTDSVDTPTYFEYFAPDGTTLRLRHDIDGVTRDRA